MKNDLWSSVLDNAMFVVQSVVIAAALVAVAYGAEKYLQKKNKDTERILTTRKIAMVGIFSAVAAILMWMEFPIPFIAPPFYELDFSELPALVGAFAFGPVAGVMIEFCKVVLKLITKGTSTAFVGDLANFVIGCSFILPSSIIYMFKKSKKSAIASCVAGTLCMTVFGSAFNGIYLLPAFSRLYGMPLDAIIQMGTEINGFITNIPTFVICAVAPINLIKGGCVSLITMLIYKPLSPILKAAAYRKEQVRPQRVGK